MPKCEMCGAEYLEGEEHTCETSKSESVVETQESTTESQEEKTE